LNVHGVYIGLVLLGRMKYTQLSHKCLCPVPVRLRLLFKSPQKYRSPGTHQIPAERIGKGGGTIGSKIHKLINSVWNEEEWPQVWKESIIFILPIYKKSDKQIILIIELFHCYQLHTEFYPSSFCQGELH